MISTSMRVASRYWAEVGLPALVRLTGFEADVGGAGSLHPALGSPCRPESGSGGSSPATLAPLVVQEVPSRGCLRRFDPAHASFKGQMSWLLTAARDSTLQVMARIVCCSWQTCPIDGAAYLSLMDASIDVSLTGSDAELTVGIKMEPTNKTGLKQN